MPTPTPGPMDTAANVLSNIGSGISSAFGWAGDALDFITENPIIWVPMVISIGVAVSVGLVKAFTRG